MTDTLPAAAAQPLLATLRQTGEALSGMSFPLAVHGAGEARINATAAAAQLEDYVVPRLLSLEAPLLAVVGGSTGAGKSTLVNALVGHPVTRSGAIRPTTRQPVLLHHPADGHWFSDQRVLPTLSRVRAVETGIDKPQAEQTAENTPGAGTLLLRPDPMIPLGLALVDAPDLDSIADENRRLSGQLLAAADLWVFVTTANRYADAVPWKLLADAAARDILLAVVLDRVPVGVEEEVRSDLHTLLAAADLGHAPIFIVPELPLDPAGMLPAEAVDPIRRWLRALAADAAGRQEIARRTLYGAVHSVAGRVHAAADAQDDQQAEYLRLQAAATGAFDDALEGILESTRDGTLLRGEVLARWQDFVGTGEFMRGLESRVGRARDAIGSFLTGRPTRAVTVETAIETGLHAVIVEQAALAAQRTEHSWRDGDAGRELLAGLPPRGDDFSAAAAREIRAWQKDLLELVSAEGANKRFTARMLSFGVNGIAVALMVVVFASTAGLSGLEIGVAGGSAVVGQKLLEAVFGEDAVRRLAKSARDNLQRRCGSLLRTEQQRYLEPLVPAAQQTPAGTLREYARRLESSRPSGEQAMNGADDGAGPAADGRDQ
ncbi:dynamin family protein [Arthrobacter sp. H20]|uniref:dynamin family protein n=1 Tax=Arthrobacter sp. H20 TaxID=1267981 RepID=UPI00047B7959|nr:dynamin family protein [Arthrobacter sp. H20]